MGFKTFISCLKGVPTVMMAYPASLFTAGIYFSLNEGSFFNLMFQFMCEDAWEGVNSKEDGALRGWIIVFSMLASMFFTPMILMDSALPSLKWPAIFVSLLDLPSNLTKIKSNMVKSMYLLFEIEVPILHYMLLLSAVGAFSGPDSFTAAFSGDTDGGGVISCAGVFNFLDVKSWALFMLGLMSYLTFYMVWEFLDFDEEKTFMDPANQAFSFDERTQYLISMGLTYKHARNMGYYEVVAAGEKSFLMKDMEPAKWSLGYIHKSSSIQGFLDYIPPQTSEKSNTSDPFDHIKSSSSLLSALSVLVMMGTLSKPSFFFCALMVDEETMSEVLNLASCPLNLAEWSLCMSLLLIPPIILLCSWHTMVLDGPKSKPHMGRRGRLNRLQERLQLMGIPMKDADGTSLAEVEVAYKKFLKMKKHEPEKFYAIMQFGKFSIQGLLSYKEPNVARSLSNNTYNSSNVPFKHFIDKLLKSKWRQARMKDWVAKSRFSSRYPTDWWAQMNHPIKEWNPMPRIKSRLSKLKRACWTLSKWLTMIMIFYQIIKIISCLP